MTPNTQDTELTRPSQAEFQELLHEKLRLAIRLTLTTILEDEVTTLIGAAPYARTPNRTDQRNGTYGRDLVTTVGKIEALAVPRTRKGFRTQLFERYHRRQQELDTAIAEIFVYGASQVRVGEVIETLTETQPSPSTVSRVFHTLEAEFQAWRTRPLAAHYAYLFADGTYFTVIYAGEGQKMPILAVVGITAAGEREVLAFTVGERENQQAWEDLFAQLKARGLQTVDLWITDGHQAMRQALQLKFPSTARQRCIKHKLENILGYIPKAQQALVEPELKAIFYQDNRAQADQAVAAFCEKYGGLYPSAVECLQRDLEACLTFYAFPKTHWKAIRTTNVIERLFLEVKKRSHKMSAAFRNEDSCLLMFYAVIRSLKFRRIAMAAK
jgi:transposase-like protein